MLKPLYMAKSIEELQSIVRLPNSVILNRLLKSAKKVFDAANESFAEHDEEKAYKNYMMFLLIHQQNLGHGNKAEQAKRCDQHMGSKNIKKSIERLETLQSSLDRRYKIEYSVTEKKEVEPVKEVKKKSNSSANSIEKSEADGTISCKKLYSLITQKSTSFLIVDVRPREHFEDTCIDISSIINIPEEVLTSRSVITADSAGRDLDEKSRLLWRKRTSYDLLIICDFKSEKPPFPKPIKVIMEAISKWDPGKNYKSKPFILSGGFDFFSMMYPVLVKNPLSKREYNSYAPVTPNNFFSFDYPDLDTGFMQTPSPPKAAGKGSHPGPIDVPIIHRNLKPSGVIEPTSNGVSLLVEKFDSMGLQPTPQENTVNHIVDAEVQPEVPCRTLKPKELLERLHADKVNYDRKREALELSIINEKETLEILKEIEKTELEKDATEDTQQKSLLSEAEQKLKDDIAKLKNRSEKLESDYDAVNKQNQHLWKVIEEFLHSQESEKTSNSLMMSSRMQKEETELMVRNKKIQELNEGVEVLRKQRKEKELKLAQRREFRKEDKKVEEQKLDNDLELSLRLSSHHSRSIERQSRPKTHVNGTDRNTISRKRGDTYTTNIKSSPRSSPVRGGTNLRRSHSAFNIAQLRDDDTLESTIMPSFDRRLKPMDSPHKRTVNAARQRNFEPKIGNVGRGKTGLKNLGNTCYMNSVIQCLNNTIPLAQFFMNNSYSDNINENSRQRGMVAEEMAAVIRALWGGHYKCISMWDLKKIVAKHHKPFFGFDQQDSHEFLLKLMDWLNDDLNMIKVKPSQMIEQNFEDMPDYVAAEKVTMEMNRRENSIVRTLFHGLHQSVITCTTCDHRSITFEPFSVLTVSLPTTGPCSLADQIREYYRISEIEYKCARCKKPRICTRKMNIWELPPVLVIHLNRFEHDVLMKKNPNFVDFPTENLDLSSYVVSSTNKYECFDLYAISNHYGTMDGGHYTAFCHSKSYGWLKFDDNEVYELPTKNVKTSAAYILFYQVSNLNSNVI